MSGPYTRAKDPFLLWDLSRPSPVRDYARHFYNQTAAYLAQGGCNYTVAHVYVWNLPSWDVQVGEGQSGFPCCYGGGELLSHSLQGLAGTVSLQVAGEAVGKSCEALLVPWASWQQATN